MALGWLGAAWLAGNAGVFALMFGIGYLLLGPRAKGAVLALSGLFLLWATLRASKRFRLASGLRDA